jgi:hypothetical protein
MADLLAAYHRPASAPELEGELHDLVANLGRQAGLEQLPKLDLD